MKRIYQIPMLLLALAVWGQPVSLKAQLSSKGKEMLAHSTIANNQQRPAVAMNSAEDYFVVWESQGQDQQGYGIYAQVHQKDGKVQKREFAVNIAGANDQRFPDVAMNAAGEAVVVWQSYSQDGAGWDIYVQRYNRNLVAEGANQRVHVEVAGRQAMPKVAIDEAGHYVVVWENDGDIYARRYSANGEAAPAAFRVNTTTAEVQNYPDVIMHSDGAFVVVWQSYGQDDDGFGIYGQRYDAAGVAQGGETLINTSTAGQQTSPALSMDARGNYVVVWTDSEADGDGKGIFGQRYYADGATLGNPFSINTTTTGAQDHADVAMTASGAFSVVWDSYGQDGDYTGVYNQSFSSEGIANGAEKAVNTTTDYFQQFPAIAIWDNAESVIVWQDGAQEESKTLDADGYGVVLRRYDAVGLPAEFTHYDPTEADPRNQLPNNLNDQEGLFTLFPNPATDFIIIEKASAGDWVEIFSASGQFLEEFQLQATNQRYAVSQLPKGSYFVKIGAAVQRLVIQ
ncbi:MAG: T9SS type A sorting domain-containing protein [Bacteroidota bacterium]